MREEHQQLPETPSERLLRDFNVQTPASPFDDHSQLRQAIQEAVRSMDEEALSVRIDEAKGLGNDFKWQDELQEAEGVLYEITCSD